MIIPIEARILGTYPFSSLADLGWQLDRVSPPKVRIPGKDPIRTAHMSWRHRTYFTFDVTESGEMSEFATFSGDGDELLKADTPHAAVLLAANSPTASLSELLAIPGVSQPYPDGHI